MTKNKIGDTESLKLHKFDDLILDHEENEPEKI